LSVMLPKIDPPSPELPLALTATAISTGTRPSTTSSAMLRRRRNTMPNSERSNLAGDIEALAGEPDENVLEAGSLHDEATHAHTGRDQRGDDVLGIRAAQHAGRPAVGGRDLRETEPLEHPSRVVRQSGRHADPNPLLRSEIRERALPHH